MPIHLADVGEAWDVLERWAKARGIRAFPMSIANALVFLLDAPVKGRRLHDVWEAIDVKHSEQYWHTDANPVMQLRLGWGLDVDEEGRIRVAGRSKN